MSIQAHKLDMIGALLEVNDEKVLAQVETLLKSATRREEIVPMTMEEYRAMIDQSLEAIRDGRVISQEDLEREMETW